MEIHQLRYFVAVAEEGSFSNAAERGHVSQPSANLTSKAIATRPFSARTATWQDDVECLKHSSWTWPKKAESTGGHKIGAGHCWWIPRRRTLGRKHLLLIA
jgi:Bacterial regulatory helix-turn-helix protein, lysR family